MSVAIVIPTLNAAKTLDRCLASVAAQTVPATEVVVVDGMSKDQTQAILLNWLGMCRVFLQKPVSIGAARNLGIEMTDAKYIISLDADDWIEPTYIEHCLMVAQQSEVYAKVGVVATSLIWPDGTIQDPKQPVTEEHLLQENCIFGASMFRRRAWEDAGKYDHNPRTYEDWDLWLRIVSYGWRVAVVRHPLFHYCPEPNCSSARMTPADHEEYCQTVREKNSHKI